MIGIAFTPFETRADVITRLALRAEERGLESVTVAEGWSLDAPTTLAEIALRTKHIGLGTSVLSVWTRTPGTLAMTATGLQRVSGGRFTLGLGAGSPPLTEGFHGQRWERPVERVREALVATRALLGGDRLPAPVDGARPLRLGVAPEAPVPIALAALTPASIRLAGELADAWSPFLWARSRLSEGRALLGNESTRVDVGVPVAFGPAANELAAWWLQTYLTRMGPIYPRLIHERFGMTDAAVMAEELTLCGPFERASEAIDAWFAAGADRVHLVLPPGRPEAELAEMVDAASAARVG